MVAKEVRAPDGGASEVKLVRLIADVVKSVVISPFVVQCQKMYGNTIKPTSL